MNCLDYSNVQRQSKQRVINKFVQLLFTGIEHFYESLTNLEVF